MGLIIPLDGSQKARARVSKFPSKGLIIPLVEGILHASSGQIKHPFKRQRTSLELIGGGGLSVGSVSLKIIKNKSQGATSESSTLQSANIARCDTTTSHLVTSSCRILQHRPIAPCHSRLSHSTTQKARVQPQNHICRRSAMGIATFRASAISHGLLQSLRHRHRP